jgi:hypothetical protein
MCKTMNPNYEWDILSLQLLGYGHSSILEGGDTISSKIKQLGCYVIRTHLPSFLNYS